jgi:1,4-dihydroxy-2-naphthoate octaprenyltransferase
MSLSSGAVWASLALGSFAAAVISVNNTRDLATDARVGKRTLAVRLGRAAMNRVYALELLLPFALLPLVLPGAWALLPGLAALPAWREYRRFASTNDGPGFNRLLAATARLQAIYAVLLSLALLV